MNTHEDSRLEAKTNYFKWFMKERRNQKTNESFLNFNDAKLLGDMDKKS